MMDTQTEVERLQERIEEMKLLLSFFAGADIRERTAPTVTEVLDRFRESWDRGEVLPVEALTVVGCLTVWEREMAGET